MGRSIERTAMCQLGRNPAKRINVVQPLVNSVFRHCALVYRILRAICGAISATWQITYQLAKSKNIDRMKTLGAPLE